MKGFVQGLQAVFANPGARYAWTKLIDGYQGDGTWPIIGQRVLTFCDLATRQRFYEPLSSYETVKKTLEWEWRADQGGHVPPEMRDHVTIAIEVFDAVFDAVDGRLVLPSPGDEPRGVHMVAVDGWEDAGARLVFRNSWGERWGKAGHGSVDRVYLDRYLRDAWLSRNARYGPTRFKATRLAAASTAQEWADIWRLENPRRRRWVKCRGRTYRCIYEFETVSMQDGAPVTVLELRTGAGIRLGWTHIHHEPDGIAVIKEFFVFPPYRRRGYGCILEREVVDVARRWNSRNIRTYLHVPDAFGDQRLAAETFGQATGYKWSWGIASLPNLAAVGEKAP